MAETWNLGTGDEGVARTKPPGAETTRKASVAIFNWQSAYTALKGLARGYDAGNKIKGRKRHIAVDSQANLLTVVEHSTGIRDWVVGAPAALTRSFCRLDTIAKVLVDGGYGGTLIEWPNKWPAFAWRWSNAPWQLLVQVLTKPGS